MTEKYVPIPILDPDTMTIGEFAAFEEVTGMSISETIQALVSGQWSESATVLTATMLIAGAREREDWTISDAAAITFADIADLKLTTTTIPRTSSSRDLEDPPRSSPGIGTQVETGHRGHCHSIREMDGISGVFVCCLPNGHTGPHQTPPEYGDR